MAPLPEVIQSWFRRAIDSDTLPKVVNIGEVTDDASASLEDDALVSRVLHRAVAPVNTAVVGSGTVSADSINNPAVFALFGLLGLVMVLASLWFFFWAKNGGFKWRETDWDDYKSTVLRRKGPDGRTLSNATRSTKLGASTIVGTQRFKWQKNMARSVVGRDEKGRKGVLGRRGWGGTHSVLYDDDYMTESFATKTVVTNDEMTELRSEAPDVPGHHSQRYRDRDVQEYKRERPARVGGLNRVPDGSHFDYTNSDRSEKLTASVISDGSSQPMLEKSQTDRERREKERAERRAREEVARMERRWKKEAEEAAAMLARENQRPAPAMTRKSAMPSSSKPVGHKSGPRDLPSASARKRDFSYNDGPESEILSTAYTGSQSNRTSSYYNEYRPQAQTTRYYAVDRPQSSSPRKKQGGGARSGGGYRRGGNDSDLD